MTIVLDASVALKAVLDEEHSDNALALIEEALRARDAMIAPVVLPSEVTNALYQQQRRGRVTTREVDVALATFLDIPVMLKGDSDLYVAALRLARRHDLRAAYDGLYLALSEQSRAELWTADRRLLDATRGASARVRWIGDYSPGG